MKLPTAPAPRRRLVLWLPEDLHQGLHHLADLERKPISDMVARWARSALVKAKERWPREYWPEPPE